MHLQKFQVSCIFDKQTAKILDAELWKQTIIGILRIVAQGKKEVIICFLYINRCIVIYLVLFLSYINFLGKIDLLQFF